MVPIVRVSCQSERRHLAARRHGRSSMLSAPRIQITLEPAMKQLGEDFGLTSRDLAQALGVDQRTVTRWSTGEAFPRREAHERLEALAALDERLTETFVSWEAARAW